MSHAINITSSRDFVNEQPNLLQRLAVLCYGVVSYILGVAALMWIILAAAGLAPTGLSSAQTTSVAAAIGINLLLIGLFAVQHSVMARPWFKARITKYIPQAMERPTYMLMTGIVTAITLYFWQPVPGIVWQLENTALQYTLWAAYALGWGYLLLATFITNHFELMGLRQVYLYYKNKPYTRLPFTNKFMYRYSRHPMMLGMLAGLWAVPTMSVTHFVLSVLFSLYIALGIFFEERDLIRQFGTTYQKYKNEIARFIPGIL